MVVLSIRIGVQTIEAIHSRSNEIHAMYDGCVNSFTSALFSSSVKKQIRFLFRPCHEFSVSVHVDLPV